MSTLTILLLLASFITGSEIAVPSPPNIAVPSPPNIAVPSPPGSN